MGFLKTCGCKGESAVEPSKVRLFTLRELSRATDSFSNNNLLGKGSHSCVYKAVLDSGRVVAVKRPTIGRRTMQDVSSFDNELEVLSKIRHQHLVNLIGYCNEASEKLLVVEFMGNGTLFDLLHKYTEPLSWPVRVHMAYQAAQAILALHSASLPIIHRDVKSSNILVDKNWNAKLGDLGLALRGHLEDVVRRKTPPAGTMGYIDPEYQTPSQLSSKSDVFSFGILLLEIISGRHAIDVRFNPSSIVDWAVPLIRQGKSLAICDPSLKPPQNLKAVKQLAVMAARSVRLSSSKRPTMMEIVEGLRQIRRMLPISPFGGKPAKNTVSHAPVDRVEESDHEDLSEDAMSSSSSIFDEGDTSPTDSSKSENSLKCRLTSGTDPSRGMGPTSGISDLSKVIMDGQGSTSEKPDHPVFDRGAPSPSWSTRNEKLHLGTCSPASSVHDPEKHRTSIRPPLESCVFGSKELLNVCSRTTPGLAAAQPFHLGFKVRNMDSLQPILSPRPSPNLRILRESVTLRDAINGDLRGQVQDPKKLTTQVDGDRGSAQESCKPVDESGPRLQTTLKAGETSKGNNNIDGKIADAASLQAQQLLRFTRGFSPSSPICGANASGMKIYTNAGSPFDKVDVPIAV